MAEQDDEDIAGEEQETGSNRKKLIIIGAGVLLLLAAVGGGTFWWLTNSDSTEVVSEEGEAVPQVASSMAIYHKLKPKFVTTYDANSRQHYLQVEVTLVTRDEDVVQALVTHQPLVRNALVMLMAKQDYLELQTQEGKIALRESAVSAIQDILQQEIGIPGIERVLFTEFVMQ